MSEAIIRHPGEASRFLEREWKVVLLFIMIWGVYFPKSAATNIVTYSLIDSVATAPGSLDFSFRNLSNSDGRTRIAFNIISSRAPFSIYKAEWNNLDTLRQPLEPFQLIAIPEEVKGKSTRWSVALDFPFSTEFSERDVLILTTDQGKIRIPTSVAGELKTEMDLLRDDYSKSKDKSRHTLIAISFALLMVCAAGVCVLIFIRRRLSQRRCEIDALTLLLARGTERNRALEDRVAALYGGRLDTLNFLCNEYFEKNDSERLRQSLFNEVERHILSLRQDASVEHLESVVNEYMDGIMNRVRRQLPTLSRNDLRFLTYLYAGFSPRAVCIFCDIKIKNFYNRRSRLKERILASGAPDRELFVSKM